MKREIEDENKHRMNVIPAIQFVMLLDAISPMTEEEQFQIFLESEGIQNKKWKTVNKLRFKALWQYELLKFRISSLLKESPSSDVDLSYPKVDPFDLMAPLSKTVSGLPVELLLDYNKSYERHSIEKRITVVKEKFCKIFNDNIQFDMTISTNPEIIPSEAKVKLRAKDVELIKMFVRNNVTLLSKLADQEISFEDFYNEMNTQDRNKKQQQCFKKGRSEI